MVRLPGESGDFQYAVKASGSHKLGWGLNEVSDMLACVPGENDEYNWWWIVLVNGSYRLVDAWCDYTGWGCQDGIEDHGDFRTAEEAALAAPQKEAYTKRDIQQNLLRQVRGEQPYALYEGA